MSQLWKSSDSGGESGFGNLVVLAFIACQALDGVLTYLAVVSFGPAVEGNPLMVALMLRLGEAPALTATKLLAASLGIALHLSGVHRLVAGLTCMYVAVAILPWTALLFF